MTIIRRLFATAALAVGMSQPVLAQATTDGEEIPCGECITCLESGIEGHNGKALLVGGPSSGLDHGCFGGISCLGHSACSTKGTMLGVTSDQMSALIAGVQAGRENAIAALFELYPSRIRINAERVALQIIGCDENTIVAHIPMTNDALALAVRLSKKPVRLAAK